MARLVFLALTILLAISQIDARTLRKTSHEIENPDLPCLGKLVGQRLPHPKDHHKFLRCISADTMWIETCPGKLVYNPSMEICDWTVVSRTTTHSNVVVKNAPVFFKVGANSKFDSLRSAKRTVSKNKENVDQADIEQQLDNQIDNQDDNQVDNVDDLNVDSQKKKSGSFVPLNREE
jgi:hypothetical protein